MTMLVDREIRTLALAGVPMIDPFDSDCLNPCSYDVKLGMRVLREQDTSSSSYDPMTRFRDRKNHPVSLWEDRAWEEIDISGATKDNPLWLWPRQFALGHTHERFNLPTTVAAQFHLKSSRAREGYGHSLAGLCDPGWRDSSLTLELHAHTAHTPLPLYPGLRIGQLTFHRLAVEPEFSYAQKGRYNGDHGVQKSKG